MEPSALAQELKGGKTIAQVAQEKGVDVNTVIDAMVAPVKERITKFVNEGGPRRHQGATDSGTNCGTVRSGRGLERHEGVVMPDRTEYATGVPSWVDLQTSDQDAAKRFYGALFGWDYDDMPMPGPGGVYSIARLRDKDAAAIAPLPPQQGAPPHWNSYVTTADVDAIAARVPDAGGQVFMPPFDVVMRAAWPSSRTRPARRYAFWQAKNRIGSEVVNEPGAFAWNELHTPDVDAAAAF